MYSYDVGSAAMPAVHNGAVRLPDVFSGPISGGVAVGVESDFWNTWYVNVGPYQTPCTLELLWWSLGGNPVTTGIMGLLSIGAATSSSDRVSINWDATNYKFGVGSTYNTLAGSTPRQEWHHIAFACDATSCLAYIDGVLVLTHTNAIANAGVEQAHIGSNGTNGAFARGVIAEPAIYGTKLSAGRIAAHFAAVDRLTDLPVKLAAAGSVGPPLSISWQNAP